MSHLIDTPFVKQVLEDVRPAMHSVAARISEAIRDTGEPPEPVQDSDDGAYEWLVARRVISLISRFERLREAQRFINGAPSTAALSKLDVSQEAWIEYHYSQFMSALASIGDICLLLCNSVFDLGIPPRLCSRDAIRENAWIKSTAVPKAVDQVEHVIREHRKRRNLDLHRGLPPDLGGISGDRMFDTMRLLAIVARSTDDAEAKRLVVRGFRLASKDIAKTMSADIDGLETAVNALLELLVAPYNERLRPSFRKDFEYALDPSGT